ncbi:RHS repeat-associated core domain-containing protein [Streptomyces pilosus]
MGHRYYDPSLDRFTQPDPSGQEANPCLHAKADPVNHSDP